MKLKVTDNTDARRWQEYPTAQEQLLVIWKALAQVKGKPWSPDVQAMIDRMAAVDAKYPRTT